MTGLCLAGGGVIAKFAVTAFTLAWVHTVEKIPWEEDWAVVEDGLLLTEARIKGSGAGMEPPPEARHVYGFYRWTPGDGFRKDLTIRRSGAANTADWSLCIEGNCRLIGAILPAAADPVRIYPCEP